MKNSLSIIALLFASLSLTIQGANTAWARDPDGQAMARAENQQASRAASNESASALRRALTERSAAQTAERREAANETAMEKREETRSVSLFRSEIAVALSQERKDESRDGAAAMNVETRRALVQMLAEARQTQQNLTRERLAAVQAMRNQARIADPTGLMQALGNIRSLRPGDAGTAYYAP